MVGMGMDIDHHKQAQTKWVVFTVLLDSSAVARKV
jgi:hypothetical protein